MLLHSQLVKYLSSLGDNVQDMQAYDISKFPWVTIWCFRKPHFCWGH